MLTDTPRDHPMPKALRRTRDLPTPQPCHNAEQPRDPHLNRSLTSIGASVPHDSHHGTRNHGLPGATAGVVTVGGLVGGSGWCGRVSGGGVASGSSAGRARSWRRGRGPGRSGRTCGGSRSGTAGRQPPLARRSGRWVQGVGWWGRMRRLRTSARKARASMHTEVCRYQEHHFRTSCWSKPVSFFAAWKVSSTIHR